MARRSRSDEIVIQMAEDLIRRIHVRAGVDKSIKQVLESDPVLMGETLMITRIFLELDHLRIEEPMLVAFIHQAG